MVKSAAHRKALDILHFFSWPLHSLGYSCVCLIINSFCSDPPDLLPLSFGRNIMNEGAFAQVSCIVTQGDQPLTISWSFHGSNITSDLGIITTPIGQQGSMLMISSVGHKHRGTYTCKASNAAGVRTQTVELKVNGENWVSYRKSLEII